jgi:hypothetical protein
MLPLDMDHGLREREKSKMGVSMIIAHEPRESLDTDYFVEQLRKKWPEAEIHYIPDPKDAILWFNIADDFGPEGRFMGTGISYRTGSHLHNADFALWYRTIVPDEWELKLYDSGLYFAIISITKETTREQIMAGFDIPFDPSIYE